MTLLLRTGSVLTKMPTEELIGLFFEWSYSDEGETRMECEDVCFKPMETLAGVGDYLNPLEIINCYGHVDIYCPYIMADSGEVRGADEGDILAFIVEANLEEELIKFYEEVVSTRKN